MSKEMHLELKKELLNILEKTKELVEEASQKEGTINDVITHIENKEKDLESIAYLSNLSEAQKVFDSNILNTQEQMIKLLNDNNNIIKTLDGSASSGNYNHKGRPGKQGGSSATGNGVAAGQIQQAFSSLANVDFIRQQLKEAGIASSEVVERFGLVPSNLLKRLIKRMEQGEDNWNSVFKNKEEYLKAVSLKQQLEQQNAIETEEYKKLYKAINRWEFINDIAKKLEQEEAIMNTSKEPTNAGEENANNSTNIKTI